MKKICITSMLLLATSFQLSAGEPLAQTPPMGWNSFDSYGVYLHEDAAFANLEAMADKLKPHGYEYLSLIHI